MPALLLQTWHGCLRFDSNNPASIGRFLIPLYLIPSESRYLSYGIGGCVWACLQALLCVKCLTQDSVVYNVLWSGKTPEDFYMNFVNSVPSNHLPKPTLYLGQHPNQPIKLYRGFAELVKDEEVIEGQATVNFGWFPSPCVKFEFTHFTPGANWLGWRYSETDRDWHHRESSHFTDNKLGKP